MLTLFTTPKPFYGHIDVIQRNALKSWTLAAPQAEVISTDFLHAVNAADALHGNPRHGARGRGPLRRAAGSVDDLAVRQGLLQFLPPGVRHLGPIPGVCCVLVVKELADHGLPPRV